MSSRRYLRTLLRGSRTAVLALSVSAIAFGAAPASALAGQGDYIVVLGNGSDPATAAKLHGFAPLRTYDAAFHGYLARLSPAQAARLEARPEVAFVSPDLPIETQAKSSGGITPLPAQTIPTGVRRVGALNDPLARIDGVDQRVDVDVAIINSGLQANHPDLNVVGGVACNTGNGFGDGTGHGTHVGGTVGALDNGFGSVGIAPGARLWGVRVLTSKGSGFTSDAACGVDWVTARASTIEVANMSLGWAGSDDGNCGRTKGDALHLAICRSVAAGVTYVVAGGNQAKDASTLVPAAYDEVISVSAFADYNGVAGGGAASTCYADEDDTLAVFSNFGADIDIAAPGVCIYSTTNGSSYSLKSGTSMSSPTVAGAAALLKAATPTLTPAQVQAQLVATQEAGPLAQDPDTSFFEGLLHLGA